MDPMFRMLLYSDLYARGSAGHHAMITLSKNLERIVDTPIDEMAEICSTNAMTLSRLVRKIGYRNFSDFRIAVRDTISQYNYLNRNIPLQATDHEHPAESFLDYVEQLLADLRKGDVIAQIDRVCPVLHEAKDIHFYGPPFQSLYMIMLLYDLMMDKKEVYYVTTQDNICADLESITKGSVILLEPSQLITSQPLCQRIIECAKRCGAKVILLDNHLSPLIQYTPDLNLIFPGDHTASSVLAMEFVINMLTMAYRERYIDET